MIYKQFIFILLFLFSTSVSFSQTALHFVFFTDKNYTPYSVDNPEEFLSAKSIERRTRQNISISENDLPVAPAYIDSIESKGAIVKYTSRWFNAALIEATEFQLEEVRGLSVIKDATKVTRIKNAGKVTGEQSVCSITENYGNSELQLSMLGITDMHKANYKGQGITIAVLDSGFPNVNSLTVFDSLVSDNRILATYDFPDKEISVDNENEHGTNVLSVLAGYKDGQLIGSSWRANYILLRTENGDPAYEKLVEEVYWTLGAEFADSAGADIINSSLGYNTFNDPATNHTFADLDGNTTIITRAAEYAFSKGMLVVNSAGNEGSSSWQNVLAPADGPHVLTVGAVYNTGEYYSLSSKGPTADNRIKPDVAALGVNVTRIMASGSVAPGTGTSFAAPIVSGFAANLWQRFPELTNAELLELIRQSGSQYNNPDNLRGYGIPHYHRALGLAGIADKNKDQTVLVYPNPANEELKVKLAASEFVSTVKIFDSNLREQKLVKIEPKGEKEHSLNISDLPKGFYFIVLEQGDSKEIRKFFKN